jgi:ribose/xylose/arabinose/galactoside ABC-type transport system permease subunit
MNAFDRAWARGPWRSVPVPAFLADRRAALRFQLAWAGGLALLVAAAALVAIGPALSRPLGPLVLLGRQAVPVLLLGLGAAAVVARGGFDCSAPVVAALAAGVVARHGSPELGLAAALACGLGNGLLVALVRVPGWLLTALTSSVLLAGARVALFDDRGAIAADPERLRWLLTPGLGVALGAVVVGALWLQLRPRGAPSSSLWERVGDVGVHAWSAALAGVAGVWSLAGLGTAALPASPGASGAELALVVVLGGTWLGSGRPNVVATAVAALVPVVLRLGCDRVGATSPGTVPIAEVVLLAAALGLSFLAHLRAARRHVRGAAGRAVLARPPGAKEYDRDLFHGPGRLLPVPAHLAERGSALRIELGWNGGLSLLLAAVAATAWHTAPALAGVQVLAGPVNLAFVPLALALGACAVVARGGFDLSAPVLVPVVAFLVARDGGLAAALVLAAGVGLGNGVLVSVARLPGWVATAVTALIVGGARMAGQLYGRGDELVPPPPGFGWVPGASWAALAVAAVGAFVWLQLAPGGDPGRPLVRWRERLGDGIPYLFSSGLAFVAGLQRLELLRGGSVPEPAAGLTVAAVIVAGCWLGSGRANVVGVILSAAALEAVRLVLLARGAPPWSLEAPVAALAILALAASRVVNSMVARSRAAAPAAAGLVI